MAPTKKVSETGKNRKVTDFFLRRAESSPQRKASDLTLSHPHISPPPPPTERASRKRVRSREVTSSPSRPSTKRVATSSNVAEPSVGGERLIEEQPLVASDPVSAELEIVPSSLSPSPLVMALALPVFPSPKPAPTTTTASSIVTHLQARAVEAARQADRSAAHTTLPDDLMDEDSEDEGLGWGILNLARNPQTEAKKCVIQATCSCISLTWLLNCDKSKKPLIILPHGLVRLGSRTATRSKS